jgi:hypothetical protein
MPAALSIPSHSTCLLSALLPRRCVLGTQTVPVFKHEAAGVMAHAWMKLHPPSAGCRRQFCQTVASLSLYCLDEGFVSGGAARVPSTGFHPSGCVNSHPGDCRSMHALGNLREHHSPPAAPAINTRVDALQPLRHSSDIAGRAYRCLIA